MYTDKNFKSKKALKEAVAARLAYLEAQKVQHSAPFTVGAVLASQVRQVPAVTIYQPNDMHGNPKAAPNYTGPAALEGPHYPEPHKWYASVQVVNGEVVKVS